ncbi:hypothetical protein IQ244_23815 [Nostoc sp. LEGE 06077]|uniref:hypothetical protein n=1 Tax=Nostoc sp. LEGE 06077 TaxID=915325 RepID=UPI00187E6D1A|nr:hypothetical protein [Nostoc sp. LEGE 06077]MBE9209468.1 hypothetical protein [Nostoc sp. LEGE 06077]
MFTKAISTTVVISWLLPQIAQAAINRDTLGGGALGIAQCQHLRGEKTKVIWRVIVNDSNKPINATHFSFQTNDGLVREVYGTVVPTLDYQTTEIFEGLKQKIIISGEAYNIRLSGIHRYSLRKPLTVQCD